MTYRYSFQSLGVGCGMAGGLNLDGRVVFRNGKYKVIATSTWDDGEHPTEEWVFDRDFDTVEEAHAEMVTTLDRIAESMSRGGITMN